MRGRYGKGSPRAENGFGRSPDNSFSEDSTISALSFGSFARRLRAKLHEFRGPIGRGPREQSLLHRLARWQDPGGTGDQIERPQQAVGRNF